MNDEARCLTAYLFVCAGVGAITGDGWAITFGAQAPMLSILGAVLILTGFLLLGELREPWTGKTIRWL